MDTPTMLTCRTLMGEAREVPADQVIVRPAAYGLIKSEGKIVVMRGYEDHFYLPGGGVELGESPEKAVVRECKEEAGLDVKVTKFLFFHENLFYYDPTNEAFHSYMFVYECEPLHLNLSEKHMDINNIEPEEPLLVDPAELTEDNCLPTFWKFTLELRKQGII